MLFIRQFLGTFRPFCGHFRAFLGVIFMNFFSHFSVFAPTFLIFAIFLLPRWKIAVFLRFFGQARGFLPHFWATFSSFWPLFWPFELLYFIRLFCEFERFCPPPPFLRIWAILGVFWGGVPLFCNFFWSNFILDRKNRRGVYPWSCKKRAKNGHFFLKIEAKNWLF